MDGKSSVNVQSAMQFNLMIYISIWLKGQLWINLYDNNTPHKVLIPS